jgi:hypothetical protein
MNGKNNTNEFLGKRSMPGDFHHTDVEVYEDVSFITNIWQTKQCEIDIKNSAV